MGEIGGHGGGKLVFGPWRDGDDFVHGSEVWSQVCDEMTRHPSEESKTGSA